MSKFSNDYVCHHIPKPVLESLHWWQDILSKPCSSQSLTTRCTVDPDVWVDTSTEWGIGVIIGQEWATWKLIPGWNKEGRDIGWAECIALELAVLIIISQGFTDCHVTV